MWIHEGRMTTVLRAWKHCIQKSFNKKKTLFSAYATLSKMSTFQPYQEIPTQYKADFKDDTLINPAETF